MGNSANHPPIVVDQPRGIPMGVTRKDAIMRDDLDARSKAMVRKLSNPGGSITVATLIAWYSTARNANAVLAGPTSGDPAAMSWRALVEADIPDLPQYARLAGRAGGQTLNGDTASGGNLTFHSTAHVTKGKILFGASAYDESGDDLGLGTTSPLITLDVATGQIRCGNQFDQDNTARASRYVIQHYDIDEQNVMVLGADISSGISRVSIGGGSSSLNAATEIRFNTATDTITLIGTRRVTIDTNGNMMFVATTVGADAQGVFVMGNGTAPTSSPVDAIQLYAEDVAASSELKVRDEAGNVTTLSPHAFPLFDAKQKHKNDPAIPWSYHSYNRLVGVEVNVDMLGLARAVERLAREQFVYVRKMTETEMTMEKTQLSAVSEGDNAEENPDATMQWPAAR